MAPGLLRMVPGLKMNEGGGRAAPPALRIGENSGQDGRGRSRLAGMKARMAPLGCPGGLTRPYEAYEVVMREL